MNSSRKVPERIGNTKQSAPAKIWCFTLNNWLEEEYSSIVSYFCSKKAKYIIGKEMGENNTPHLQGHVEFPDKLRFTSLSKVNIRIHWEKCRNKKSSITYCKKDNDYITNMFIPRKIKFPIFDKQWQLDILKLIKDEPDDRTIYWYYDEEGGKGKTTFTKYLALDHNAILCPSKSNDAFHRVSKCFDEDGEQKSPIDLVIFDIPRSSKEYINYGVIEKIKDGLVISGKYEGCECIFASPHVIVFCNEEPYTDMLSLDRWKIVRICDSPSSPA